MNTKKLLNQLYISQPCRTGFKKAMTDMGSVMIAALLSGVMAYKTSENPEWLPYAAYVIALAVMLCGMLVSCVRPGGLLFYLISNSIMALVCVTASVDVLKAITTYVLMTEYWDTPLGKVPSFVLNNSSAGTPIAMILFSTLYVSTIMFAHRWFDEVQRAKREKEGDILMACD